MTIIESTPHICRRGFFFVLKIFMLHNVAEFGAFFDVRDLG